MQSSLTLGAVLQCTEKISRVFRLIDTFFLSQSKGICMRDSYPFHILEFLILLLMTRAMGISILLLGNLLRNKSNILFFLHRFLQVALVVNDQIHHIRIGVGILVEVGVIHVKYISSSASWTQNITHFLHFADRIFSNFSNFSNFIPVTRTQWVPLRTLMTDPCPEAVPSQISWYLFHSKTRWRIFL